MPQTTHMLDLALEKLKDNQLFREIGEDNRTPTINIWNYKYSDTEA